MRPMKRDRASVKLRSLNDSLVRAAALLSLALLSGCVVVPREHRGGVYYPPAPPMPPAIPAPPYPVVVQPDHGRGAYPVAARTEIRIGGYFEEGHRREAHRYYREHGHREHGHGHRDHEHRDHERRDGFCPPGLAKKGNGCMPPGQARQWQMGRPLPREVQYYPVEPAVQVRLGHPPAGHQFVRVASDILLIAVGTGMVIDAIQDLGGY